MGDGIFSSAHLIIVAIVFVALFGASKLPIFARSLGQSMRIFKSEIKGLKDDDETAPAPPALAQPPVVQQPVATVPQYVQQPAQPPQFAQPAAAQQFVTGPDGQQYVLQPVTPEQTQTEQH